MQIWRAANSTYIAKSTHSHKTALPFPDTLGNGSVVTQNSTTHMADKNNKVPENAPGAWYVDNDLCTPCRVCLDEAPGLLQYNADESKVYFTKQPEGDELAQAQAARDVCPQAAIAEDGE